MKDEFELDQRKRDFQQLRGQVEKEFEMQAKLEQKIRDQGVKYRMHLRDLVQEMEKGARDLHGYYTKITTDEREAKKAAKKGKMFANSVKALGNYLEQALRSLESLDPLLEDVEDPSWSHDSLKKWTRSVARLLEKIDKERAVADKIMGIDFMIKKRKLNRPLSQALKQINQLKDFLQKDYMLIKYHDDITLLLEQMQEELNQLEGHHDNYVALLTEKSSLENEINEIDKQIGTLQSSPFMEELQELKIKLKRKELEITGKFNTYKKIFSNLVSASRKGEVPLGFELVGIARDYHDHPLEAFLKENDEFTRIKTLAQNLLTMTDYHAKLKIKGKERNRLEGLVNVNVETLRQLKEDYQQLQEKIATMLKDRRLKEINDKITKLEEKKQELLEQVSQLEEEHQVLASKMREIITAFEEKHERIRQFVSLVQSFQPNHVK